MKNYRRLAGLQPNWQRQTWHRTGRVLSWMLVGLLIGLSAWTPGALGQLSFPPTQSAETLPSGVKRLGLIEVTDVRFDGQPLFKIASPTVYNRNEPGSQVPVEARGSQIQANLTQLTAKNPTGLPDASRDHATLLDPKTLEVYTETLNGQPVLFVKDAYLAEPRVLLTVTDSDAQYYSISAPALAVQWQNLLGTKLREALSSRQPDAIQRQGRLAIAFILGIMLLTFLLAAVWRRLGKRQKQLEQQRDVASPAATATPPHPPLNPQAGVNPQVGVNSQLGDEPDDPPNWVVFEHIQRWLSLRRRLKIVHFLRWLIFWLVVLLWVAGLAMVLYQFPETRAAAMGVISSPIVVLVAWFLTGLINRLANLGIDQFAKAWADGEFITVENLQRRSLRISTIANVLKGLTTVVVYTIGIGWVLQRLNIAPASVLALGAIVALAVSFAAQSLVKDLVNGFLILLEDQYAIGDYVAINNVSGLVENLNLRITQLRSDAGNLITIPNSQVIQAENMSRAWSRTDFRIQVAYDTDIDQALAIVRDVADELSKDSDWGALILNASELLGIDDISHTGIVIRTWIRTQPLKQWIVAREFRRRLKLAFDHHNIQIGMPQPALSGNLMGRIDVH